MKLIYSSFILVIVFAVFSCKKNSNDNSTKTKQDYLVSKTWTFDTATINPPATYESIGAYGQLNYQQGALDNFRGEQLKFSSNGQGTGLYQNQNKSFSWRLINNNNDMEVTSDTGIDTLQNWNATATQFYFTIPLDAPPPNGCTIWFK